MDDRRTTSWWARLWPFECLRRTRLLRERIALASQYQEPGVLHDPIEDDPSLAAILAEANALAEAAAPDTGIGHCHHFWTVKKRILKKRFDIEWFSEADMNPGTFFD